ncbi:hypothetical protein [Leifsonia sp. 2MCAF36]|uniref:hypothetical protein n=1 Tax=Leifsonia sp. 2MCAF36 TaxID=3232988 RepID=UPI003F957ADB
MTPRVRAWLAGGLTVVLLGGAAVYGVLSFVDYQKRSNAPSQVETVDQSTRATGARIVFRNTASGAGYGMVASVPLNDPAGARTVTREACDRVYATADDQMCLHTDRGVVTTFQATLTDAKGETLKSWPLPGIPSRTRISADSKLVAQTSFITGESYAAVGFSTQTTISSTSGTDYGNLEDFAFLVDGQRVTAADKNFWGVTFASDDNTFYATGASGGKTWLVKGDLAGRTLTAVHQTAECPSLSPDGTKVAYKKNVSTGPTPYWTLAVFDLATGTETMLPVSDNVDDQALWLDDSTLLFGLADARVVGDSNVWSIPIDGSAKPTLFLRHAWSPSVVR